MNSQQLPNANLSGLRLAVVVMVLASLIAMAIREGQYGFGDLRYSVVGEAYLVLLAIGLVKFLWKSPCDGILIGIALSLLSTCPDLREEQDVIELVGSGSARVLGPILSLGFTILLFRQSKQSPDNEFSTVALRYGIVLIIVACLVSLIDSELESVWEYSTIGRFALCGISYLFAMSILLFKFLRKCPADGILIGVGISLIGIAGCGSRNIEEFYKIGGGISAILLGPMITFIYIVSWVRQSRISVEEPT